MKRHTLILFLLVFAIAMVPIIVHSSTILEFNETAYIDLKPAAYDPDNDPMTYFFNPPLSSEGTWQTNYGDEGIYNTKVTVSDGRLLTTENITIIIHKKDEPPKIEILAPPEQNPSIIEGESIFFNILATDINKDSLNITWILDNKEVSSTSSYTYQADYYSHGNNTLLVIVSDGLNTVPYRWLIEVQEFDRASLLEGFKSLTVKETDLVKFDLPDFAKYQLYYNISEPLGNDAELQTTYDDAGLYTITIRIFDDKQFQAEKTINLLVENVDRPANFLDKISYWIAEDQLLQIYLNYTDPDGDNVDVIAYDLPRGAAYINKTVIWKLDFDTVTKKTILDDVARRYHIMNKAFIIHANASSQNFTVMQDFEIRVFNTNRPPVLDAIPSATIYEGQMLSLNISVYDPDNDTLSYSFEGLINKNPYQTNIDQAGTYIIKVTVSDGFLDDFKYVKVVILPVNQPPVFNDISQITISEGQTAEVVLEATDPDGDKLLYSASLMPNGAYMQSNKFVLPTDYDTVQGEQSKIFEINFTVTDRTFNVTKSAKITVNNVNRAPIITTSAQVDGQEFYAGDEISLFVNIFDPDNDELSYTWQTSPSDNFIGNNSLSVIYKTTGKKAVSVTVSDGSYSVKRDWQFSIKKRPEVKLIYLNK